jgi:starch-binding outer membrane protein, SusD/RagB family
MKKYIYLIFTFILASSCEVEGLNDTENSFTDSPIGLVLNHSILNVVSIAEAEAARVTSIFSDQFTGVDRQYGTLNGYSTVASNYDALWEDFYQRGITQAQITKTKAIESGNSSVEGQALILEGYYFGEAALLFGDIPFSEVNGESTDPTYEDQKTVINGAIGLLDQGISKVGQLSASNNVFTTDSRWAQIANALKARYYLALKNYANAKESAETANFQSSSNDWAIIHSDANYGENLFWQFEVEQRQDYLKVENSYMSRLLDPTSEIYRGNTKTDESKRFSYYVAENGLSLNTTDGFAAQKESFPVISFEEVQLIIAESSLLNASGDEATALAALNKVRANNAIKFNSQYDAYSMTDFETGGILNKNLNKKDALRLEILLEKYCSVIGLPTYQDVLRTKNLIGVPIKSDDTEIIPQRFLYPLTESSSNSNFPGLIDQFVPTKINQ